jgi:hypothetical protein
MDEQDSSGTHDSPIGITSNNACKPSEHERRMKAVSFVARFYIICDLVVNTFQYLQYPSLVAVIVSRHRATGRMSKQAV